MPKWNEGQQAVLDSLKDKKNILVSAAAGSGKTAVLVERVIQTIEQGLADIDEILVVTFTKNAAAQMKQKIIKALEKKASEGANEIAASQLIKADSAVITTIDSFCNSVVKENFNAVGIDPSFDLYDSEEYGLLMDEILETIISNRLREDEAFRNLTDFFMENVSTTIQKEILNIHKTAVSFASPKKWFENARRAASVSGEEIYQEKWFQKYYQGIKSTAKTAAQEYEKMMEPFKGETDSYARETAEKIVTVLNKDFVYFRNIEECSNPADLDRLLDGIESASFRAKTYSKVYPMEDLEEIGAKRKILRDTFKNTIRITGLLEEADYNRDKILKILEVAQEFDDELLKRNIKDKKFDFADISHFAYQVLFDETKGEPTAVGRMYSERFKYIYIDEYQDSNDLQEQLLLAIAKRDEKGNAMNQFMVGDVKQSIYRFRLAKPDLFMDKARNYKTDEELGKLITLNMNYRSRKEILAATNFVFEHIMSEIFGGIAYDKDARLNPPADDAYCMNYPQADATLNVGGKPEIVLITPSEEDAQVEADDEGDEEEELLAMIGGGLTKQEIEAVEVAWKIFEIMNGDPAKGIKPLYILNKEYDPELPESEDNSQYRRVRFGDIQILQRTIKGTSNMVDVYESLGIPAELDDSSGYFDAIEITTVLSMLQCINNQQQDIPYVSVLTSHFGGVTSEELAQISLSEKGSTFYEKALNYIEEYRNSSPMNIQEIKRDLTAQKLQFVNDKLARWRELKPLLSIVELLELIYKETDIIPFVLAMPDGERRAKNLEMLKVRGEKFGAAFGGSLFNFLRYIDKCKVHDVDFGEAASTSDASNVVHITTMHKSKGLEYPVVICPLLDKEFNLKDHDGLLSVSSESHLSMDQLKKLEGGMLLKKKGIKKRIISENAKLEVKAEECRLFYVAMTRACEKLVLVGEKPRQTKIGYDANTVMETRSMMGYLLDCMEDGNYSKFFNYEEVSVDEIKQSYFKEFKESNPSYTLDMEKLREKLQKKLEEMKREDLGENPYTYQYPHNYATQQKTKLSVSEVKHAIMDMTEEAKENSQDETVLVEKITSEAETSGQVVASDGKKSNVENEQSVNPAAIRGTIIHRIMELLDYEKLNSRADFTKQIKDIMARDEFSDEDREINLSMIYKFYSEEETSLCQRMKRASLSGKLYREQQFLAGLHFNQIPDGVPVVEEAEDGIYRYEFETFRGKSAANVVVNALEKSEGEGVTFAQEDFDFVTIQGIIDAYMENEDGTITLIDYKTDYVQSGKELTDRYIAQMYLYRTALEEMTGKKVNEIVLFSYRLGEVKCEV